MNEIGNLFMSLENTPLVGINEWIKKNNADEIILYGAGIISRFLIPILQKVGLNIVALSDSDKTKWNTTIMGVPCVPPSELVYHQGSLVIAIIQKQYQTAFPEVKGKLIILGYKNIIHFTELKYIAEIQKELRNSFMLSLLELPMKKHKNEIELLFHLLDKDSKKVLIEILGERIINQPASTKQGKYIYHPDELFRLSSEDVIVDCGAYTGDTLENFCEFGYSYKKYFAIEPDLENVHKMREVIAQLPQELQSKTIVIPKAIGRFCGHVSFENSLGLNSRVIETGINNIPCITLDSEFCNEKITYLKMDIEGYEMNALEGAEKIIRRDRPILAISIYHYPLDLWEIPLWIHEHFPFYNFHIRSYDSIDIVCYAIPNK